MTELSELLQKSEIEFLTNYNLSLASTFHVGGVADLAVFPTDEKELLKALLIARSNGKKFEVIGNGSNVLFSDDGYRGMIVFTKKMNKVSICENVLTAQCGVKLITLSNLARENSLSGLEFAHGIPGSVGGAVAMNAGAYGSQMSDIVLHTHALDISNQEIICVDRDGHNFSYRTSLYTKNKNLICTQVTIELKNANRACIEDLIRRNTESRVQKQPLNYPSCGSFFKRPEGYIAAKLIDDCGLKGMSVGDAQVSQKHAGFIINKGKATTKDILELADIVKNKVFDKYKVELEREVKYIE